MDSIQRIIALEEDKIHLEEEIKELNKAIDLLQTAQLNAEAENKKLLEEIDRLKGTENGFASITTA